MTGFVSNFPVLGTQPEADYFVPDTTQRQPLGFMVTATHPYWGGAELIYAKAGAALTLGNITQVDATNTMTALPNTANLGRPFFIALTNMAINTFGWFMSSGRWVINSTASVAAGASIGIAAAGQGGANSAGKQLLGVQVLTAATQTVLKSARNNGISNVVTLVNTNADGWFIGMAITGTGIAASSVITGISSDGMTVTLNNNTTAAINGTLTGTYTAGAIFWNTVTINRPSAQGAIT